MNASAIKAAYRRYAPNYDLIFGPVLEPGRRSMIRKMRCLPDDQVLEVGVGTGLSLPTYPRSVRVAGIDLSPEMLSRARELKEKRGLNNVLALLEMDAERMSFPDNIFDKVVAMYVASVVADPVRMVAEMRRVCKPGGELFILNHFRSTNILMSRIEKLMAPFSSHLGFKPDFSLERFLADTGLQVIERRSANLFGYWTMLRCGNLKVAETKEMRFSAAAAEHAILQPHPVGYRP